MILNLKKGLNSILIASFMFFNQYQIDKKDFSSPESFEEIIEREEFLEIFKTISFEEALDKYSLNTKKMLLDNVLKNNTFQGIDSVIKYVPKEEIRQYLSEIDKENSFVNIPGYNRLETLLETGKGVSNKRFRSGKDAETSLKNYTSYLNIRTGAFGSNTELKNFVLLYKEDFVRISEEKNMSPALLAAISAHESRGRTFTASHEGALGPFGLTSYIYNPRRTWSDGRKRDPINPFYVPEAMERAADFLKLLIDKYEYVDDANKTLALIAYHEGEPVVNRAIRTARKENKNPLEFIDYSHKLDASNIETFSKVLADYFEDPKNLVSLQGREYPSKIIEQKSQIEHLF